MPRRVGDQPTSDSHHRYSYIKVDYDRDGWADADIWLPDDFDLCYLRCPNGNVKIGWRSCGHWDGFHVDRYDDFNYWKPKDAGRKKTGRAKEK